ncbi:MAG: hypothetical protein Q7S84_03155 [bacterium]|nr:hypothetical protein [bacterium]
MDETRREERNEASVSGRLAAQEQKLDAIYRSVEKMRKYFKWTLIVTIAVIVLPAIGLIFAIPAFIKSVSLTSGAGLGF